MIVNTAALREFFDSGITYNYTFRKEQLLKLKATIKKYQSDLILALQDDLNKPEVEAFTSEIWLVYDEINYAVKHLKSWMKQQQVRTPISAFYAKSYINPVPLGVVLIVAPWNYPIQLLFVPLIGAIAAGNCVVIKPSEYAQAVTNVIRKIIFEAFSSNYIAMAEGDGAVVVPELLNNFTFNHVFFTGSTNVGRNIASICAAKLIPYTLELGGKSPAIIDKNVDLDVAVKRLVWAKFFNAGQTCVAPDYVLVDQIIKPQFVAKLTQTLDKFYSQRTTDLAKIINKQRFSTLCNYLETSNIIYGGNIDAANLRITPTLIDEPELNSKVMCEEIFGPILPIISYSDFNQVKSTIQHNPNPLALYVFSRDRQFIQNVMTQIQFGGGCINTGLMHLANVALPFGGVMSSGQGKYHGKYSFDTFSHQKAIVVMATWVDIFLKYPPYTKFKFWLLKKLLA